MSGGALRRIGFALVAGVVLAGCGPTSAVAPSPTPNSTAVAAPSPSTLPSLSPSPSAPAPEPVPSSSPPPSRMIMISLSAQHLWACEGGVVIITTDVTTGMPALATPTGEFQILAKTSPYEFVSPWPRGSPYYYDPLWVDYAMLFAQGGFFIHDAWWQPNFGPGANLKTGSHGCVNVPPPAMPYLYAWARVGDRVVVVD